LPLTSSTFLHKPTGEAFSAQAAEDMSAAAKVSARAPDRFKIRILMVSKGILLSCCRVVSIFIAVSPSSPVAT
jgi:hypothetical protein